MKTLKHLIPVLLLVVIALSFAPHCHAQTATDVASAVTDAGTTLPSTPTDSTGATFTLVVAILTAVVGVARLVVKLTPTPKDDSVMEKIVNFLKHVGLQVK